MSTQQTPRERAAQRWNGRTRPTPRPPITADTIAAAVHNLGFSEPTRYRSIHTENYPDTEPRNRRSNRAQRTHLAIVAAITVGLLAVIAIAKHDTNEPQPIHYGTAPRTECNSTPTPSHILCYQP